MRMRKHASARRSSEKGRSQRERGAATSHDGEEERDSDAGATVHLPCACTTAACAGRAGCFLFPMLQRTSASVGGVREAQTALWISRLHRRARRVQPRTHRFSPFSSRSCWASTREWRVSVSVWLASLRVARRVRWSVVGRWRRVHVARLVRSSDDRSGRVTNDERGAEPSQSASRPLILHMHTVRRRRAQSHSRRTYVSHVCSILSSSGPWCCVIGQLCSAPRGPSVGAFDDVTG